MLYFYLRIVKQSLYISFFLEIRQQIKKINKISELPLVCEFLLKLNSIQKVFY